MTDLRSLALAAILGALLTHGAWWMWGVKTNTLVLIDCPADYVSGEPYPRENPQ